MRIHNYNGASIKIKEMHGSQDIRECDQVLRKDKHLLSHYISTRCDVLTVKSRRGNND
jgi:hypothetical protein